MAQHNVSAPKNLTVTVTGASCFIASHIVKQLLEAGYNVRATTRDINDESKIGFLRALAMRRGATDRLQFFQADLTQAGSFEEAVKGADYVVHVASPFAMSHVKNAKDEWVDLIVSGTENVLTAVNKAETVKRVVFTSSVAAICGNNDDKDGEYTEEDVNHTSTIDDNPYALAKTLAEQKAWEMSKAQDRWDLVTIIPGMVVGPLLSNNVCAPVQFMMQIIDGSLRMGVPKAKVALVDVRDAARAHIAAIEKPNAQGRYIVAPECYTMKEIADDLRPRFDGYPLPKRHLPTTLLYIIGPMKGFSWHFIRHSVNVPLEFSCDKICNELGFHFRPVPKALNDMVESIIERGLVEPRPSVDEVVAA